MDLEIKSMGLPYHRGQSTSRSPLPPFFTFLDHSPQIRRGADLEGARLGAGVLGHELDGVLEIIGLQDENAAYLLLRLRVGAVNDDHLSVFPPKGGGAPGALQGLPSRQVAVFAQGIVVV